ncbi:Penton [Micropterus dolomieu adomavirus 1]|uniref:LO5 n=1 Tax=Micropterus dolomieu adomavirus 1 TaxID=2744370 RepID=A0AAE8YGD8_9VIRU|nr:LO5 [Micropterus dolomieu adomavirus 1]
MNLHWEDYYNVCPDETGRPIYVTFDYENGSVSHTKIQHPGFKIGSQGNLSSNSHSAGISLVQLSGLVSFLNISHWNMNDIFFYGKGTSSMCVMRTAHYASMKDITQEMASLAEGLVFTCDFLGFVKSECNDTVYLPTKHNGVHIPDNLAYKLGFNCEASKQQTHGNGEWLCVPVDPNARADSLGDIFSPITDALVSCDQTISTQETGQVIASVPIASFRSRTVFSYRQEAWYRPVRRQPVFDTITLTMLDRSERSIRFGAGIPAGIISLIHL